MDLISKCEICPRKCKVNRYEKKGYCRCDDKVRIALVSKHYFEEPCISGRNGSGTIFFSNCNLNCVFCQNHDISQDGKGIDVTVERLAEIMLEQQEREANNINLVTPTMYVEQIIKAIDIAKDGGLNIPIVYNTNGYEEVETIKKLNGYIDIYICLILSILLMNWLLSIQKLLIILKKLHLLFLKCNHNLMNMYLMVKL